MFYLDTSVLVAALTNEPRTDDVQRWLSSQPAGELAISDWVITEFSGALSTKLRTQQLRAEDRAESLSLFATLRDESLHVFGLSRLDFHTAARFADQQATGLRSGDALHLAVAANHGLRLVSLDRGLVEGAAATAVSAQLL
ncbi:MAG: type II toxin-antitoxin system VapC family toxin [Halofilum sp. (in: g-proteobacteria)]